MPLRKYARFTVVPVTLVLGVVMLSGCSTCRATQVARVEETKRVAATPPRQEPPQVEAKRDEQFRKSMHK